MPEGQSKLPPEALEVLREPAQDLGLDVGALTAIFDERDQDLTVLGEVKRDEEDERDFELVVVVYDSNGDPIAEETSKAYREGRFKSFDTFKITVFDLISKPHRIKVFPRAIR